MPAVHRAGALFAGVPTRVPVASGSQASERAIPKSTIFGVEPASITFAALRSQWTMPRAWTAGIVAPAGDVWALGVILFEAATGRLPFAGFEAGRCPQLTETAPPANCSALLDRVIAMCLARDPTRRPTMIAVAEMLRDDAHI